MPPPTWVISGSLRSWAAGSGRIPVGTWGSLTRAFSPADVAAFAALAGDDNPIHLDAAYAAGTRWGGPIVHGMLVAALFGTLFGAAIPGSVYVSQRLRFLAPVHVGQSVTARVTVAATAAARGDTHRATCATLVTRGDGVVAVEGEAVVLLPGGGGGGAELQPAAAAELR